MIGPMFVTFSDEFPSVVFLKVDVDEVQVRGSGSQLHWKVSAVALHALASTSTGAAQASAVSPQRTGCLVPAPLHAAGCT